MQKKLTSIEKYKGRLSESANIFLESSNTYDKITKEVMSILVYSRLKHDEDTANTKYQAMADKAMQLLTKFNSVASFIEPEIIALGHEKAKQYMEEIDELKIYSHYFDNIFRQAKHVLSADKEAMLAQISEITNAPDSIYSLLSNADMTFESVLDSEGKYHALSHGSCLTLMESSDRVLRKNTFKAYYKPYIAVKNTIAEAYNYSIKSNNFNAKIRNYPSSMEMSLSENNIPITIYKNLIETVNKNLHLYHRYINIRKKCLGLDEFHLYDKYVPIIENANTTINWQDSKDIVLKGVACLGNEYVDIVKKAFNERWIDVYENKGKKSGAYSSGAFGTKPYILMNFNDTYGDMFTLAHELGHSVHSYYSNQNQPQMYSNYSIFLAEIASTVNEALIMDYLLKNTDDKAQYNYLLNLLMSNFDSTFFRQTMFAEFEMLTHEMAEKGESLNTDSLNGLYYDLICKYFGKDVVIDEEIAYEWSRIPHFYSAFYVYQYATGFSAAMAFSKEILLGNTQKYLNLLKNGSSNYSIELLKLAGIDMTSPQPIESAFSIFEDLLNKFEKANF